MSAQRPKSTHCAHYVPSHDHGVKWSKALEGAIGGLHLAHKTKNGEGAESAFHAQRTLIRRVPLSDNYLEACWVECIENGESHLLFRRRQVPHGAQRVSDFRFDCSCNHRNDVLSEHQARLFRRGRYRNVPFHPCGHSRRPGQVYLGVR